MSQVFDSQEWIGEWESGLEIPPHTHQWIDRDDPPIARATYSPVVGARRREMKPGRMYHCRECPAVLKIPAAPHGADTPGQETK